MKLTRLYKETGDYLSYATLLDIHLSDPERYNDEEKLQLLNKLHDILSENLDVVREIGWDLPELLINFYDLEWDYTGSLLRETGLIKAIMDNFDLVAKNGNAKELFLKSIELLTTLEDFDASNEKSFKIADIKLHTLIELLNTSLKRINTIYPSRFLSMATASLLRAITMYCTKSIHTRFVLRRLYAFARDYMAPLKPNDYLSKHGITQEEADKIEDDENFLQRKLLQSFLTQISEITFLQNSFDLSVELYKSLQYKCQNKLPPPDENNEEIITSSRGLFTRVTQLALSFDLDLADDFEKMKKSSVELFEKIDLKKHDDEKMQDILKFAVNDKISHLYHPESKEIPFNVAGELNLITMYTREISHVFPITIREAVAIALRLLSPGLISEKFQNKGSIDTCLFWCWVAIISSKQKDFQLIPHHELILFLQILIYYASTHDRPSVRLVLYTLLTRVLTTIDEDTSYNFLVDTLTTAPFLNAKAAVVTILKDLIVRVKPTDIDVLTDELEKAHLENDETKPKLPERHYIELKNDRIDDIYALIRESIDETFHGEEMNPASFKVTLGYLNLLITIKDRFPDDKIKEIVKVTKKNIENLKDEQSSDDPTVNVNFISMALESLS